jgi:hypothetical protein
MRPSPPQHLVRRLAAAVDFSFVRGLTRRLYGHTGHPSADPEVLFKLWLLGYLFNITSERRLCEEAGLNLAWRWFLGYELDEALPDHSVLSKARRRFGTEDVRAILHANPSALRAGRPSLGRHPLRRLDAMYSAALDAPGRMEASQTRVSSSTAPGGDMSRS